MTAARVTKQARILAYLEEHPGRPCGYHSSNHHI